MKSIITIGNNVRKFTKKNNAGILILFCNCALATIFLPIYSCASTTNGNGENAVNELIKNIDGETVTPRNANTIYISPFINKSAHENIPADVVKAIKEILTIDGRLAVVDDPDKADVMLEGLISSFTIQNIDYGDVGVATKRRMRLTAAVRFYDLKKKKLIFYEPEIQSFKEFSDVVPPIEREDFVREYVIDHMAERIAKKVITGWYTEFLTPREKGKKG